MMLSRTMLLLAALAVAAGAHASNSAEFQQNYAAAQEARAQAAAVGGEWRDVEKLLKEATGHADAGDFGAAVEKAQAARKYSQLGYQQAVSERQGYQVPPQVR